jgi:peptide/nickel transport system substrate-binding protein
MNPQQDKVSSFTNSFTNTLEETMPKPRAYLSRSAYFSLLMAAVLGITGCTPAGNGSKALVYGATGDPVNLEPGNVTDGNSLVVQVQIYDRLLDFRPGTAELQPGLATAWSSDATGRVWTFKLRPDVKFHDGTAFNADAVAFNFRRWWDAADPQGYRQAGKVYEIWTSLLGGVKNSPSSILKEIKVIDPQTIQFELKQPFAMFPDVVASAYFGIASPTAIQKAGARYGTPGSLAVGTGPFQFKEWRTGDRVVLNKNATYWQPQLPKSPGVVFRFVKDPSARLAQLRAGQLDFTVDLVPDQRGEVSSDPQLKTVIRPTFNVGYLALNPTYKPLADVRVREAIAHSLNRPALVKSFWGGLGQTDEYFTPPLLTPWAKLQQIKGFPYDPAKAKQLLTAAGYGQGFDLDLWYMPVSRQSFPVPKAIAEAMAADLGKVGIRAKLKTQDWAAYLAGRNKPPGYQSFMMGWTGDYGSADNFFYPHFGPGGTQDIGNWKDETLWQLLEKARATPKLDDRNPLYDRASAIVRNSLLRVPIVHSQALLAQRKSLGGWTPSPLGIESFAAVQK